MKAVSFMKMTLIRRRRCDPIATCFNQSGLVLVLKLCTAMILLACFSGISTTRRFEVHLLRRNPVLSAPSISYHFFASAARSIPEGGHGSFHPSHIIHRRMLEDNAEKDEQITEYSSTNSGGGGGDEGDGSGSSHSGDDSSGSSNSDSGSHQEATEDAILRTGNNAGDKLEETSALKQEGEEGREERQHDPESSCRSKEEQRHYYKTSPSGGTNEEFQRKLEEYDELHRRCSQVDDWAAYYEDQYKGWAEGASLHKCKYILVHPPEKHGLGNQIMSLVSIFIYALLTDRALLMDQESFLGKFLCSPLKSSTMTLSQDVFGPLLRKVKATGAPTGQLEDLSWDQRSAWGVLAWNTKSFAWKFFCKEEQWKLSQARFVGFDSDQFFVPGLYLIPSFQTKLEKWFPDRKPFMNAARFLLHPKNYLWEKITDTFHTLLSKNSVRVGIQIRFFYDVKSTNIEQRVLKCAIDYAKYLPTLEGHGGWMNLTSSPEGEQKRSEGKSVGVYVTSLKQRHSEFLKKTYAQYKPLDGSTVNIYGGSHEEEEAPDNIGQYEKALVEMWVLSFCDFLITSDYSTFGYVASGLSGTDPFSLNIAIMRSWTVDFRYNNRPVCQTVSSEPCYLKQPDGTEFKCKEDGETNFPSKMKPHIKGCPAIGEGLYLYNQD